MNVLIYSWGPWKNEKLIATISSALELRRTRLETAKLRIQKQNLCETLNQPLRSYVVENDITSAQNRSEELERNAVNPVPKYKLVPSIPRYFNS